MAGLEEKVRPEKSAVIVIDVQNDFCHERGSMARRGQDLSLVKEMMPRLHAFIEASRQNKVSILYTKTVHSDWTDSPTWRQRLKALEVEVGEHLRENTWGPELYEVQPRADERVIEKRRYSAFFGTELDIILRSRGIQTLLLTGVATNVCVETTARDGYMLDYNIVLVEDCAANYDLGEHRATLRNVEKYFGSVATSQEVQEAWKALGVAAIRG